MSSLYRKNLPQLQEGLFITDGGLETTLVFHEGMELPGFAAFVLLKDAHGIATLRRYYSTYAELARRYSVGLVLEAPTWRSNPDWGARLGYAATDLARFNRDAISLLEEVRATYATPQTKIVISGCVGPRGDGYVPGARMTSAEAADYHSAQIGVFAKTAADMIGGFTVNYIDEGVGIAIAAQRADIPVTISFTVETDGRLPSGESLQSAIEQTDSVTCGYPVYYMINCAHPVHFQSTLETGRASAGTWLTRIRGLRANSSRKSHAELDSSTELDMGNPVELGEQYQQLRPFLGRLAVVGGCCGTDHRHVEAICQAVM